MMYGELPAPVAVAHKCHSSNIVDVLNLFWKGPDRARRHSPCRVDRYSLAVLKQSLEDQLAQFNKALKKAMADVTEFTTLLDAE